MDFRGLLLVVDLVVDWPVEVVVVAVEQPWLEVQLSLMLSKYSMDAVELLESTSFEVVYIDLDLAIDPLSNLLDLLDTTKIDRLTMSRLDGLDHCRCQP